MKPDSPKITNSKPIPHIPLPFEEVIKDVLRVKPPKGRQAMSDKKSNHVGPKPLPPERKPMPPKPKPIPLPPHPEPKPLPAPPQRKKTK
ncbi:MAG: hypothetical protein ABSE27_11290 [Acidobacteriaceae bacterium]|jgi:hypothetical protein